eukprot:GEMP01035507.1.p1 GENE.GEMP01035507.1~~GEMP01035507.1.p1  ORF type:complete len:522 (+),score=72.46 GEMP01035507.1:153-1718(+)
MVIMSSYALRKDRRTAKQTGGDQSQDAAITIQSAWRRKMEEAAAKTPAVALPQVDDVIEVVSPVRSRAALNVWRMRQIRIYLMVEEPSSSRAAKMTQYVILSTIVVSIIALSMETMPELWGVVPSEVWSASEAFCTFVFTVEYGLRLWSCTVVQTRAAFISTFVNITDLLAVIPFYVDLMIMSDYQATGNSQMLRSFRVFRLIRIFRVFKLGRHSAGLRLMFRALAKSMQALVVLLFFLVIGIILFSALIYHAEKMSCARLEDIPQERKSMMVAHMEALTCPNKPRVGWSQDGLCCDKYNSPLNFRSIAVAFWWCIVTMTTVGYGDIVPRTPQGKVVAAFAMVLGILLIALSVAIVGMKFQEVYEETQMESRKMREKNELLRGGKSSRTLRSDTVMILEKCNTKVKPSMKSAMECSLTPTACEQIVTSRQMRRDTLAARMADVYHMRLIDDECTEMVKQLCSYLTDYHEITDDHFHVHESFTRRNSQLMRHISTLVDGLNETLQSSKASDEVSEEGGVIVN